MAEIKWSTFLAWIAGACLTTLSGAVVLAISIDPYGYLGVRRSHQVAALPERLITVTRARDPNFNSAIVGNSVTIPVHASNLSALTGQRFVSLGISGTGPEAQLAVLKFFIQHHDHASDVVIGFDEGWCAPEQDLAEHRNFPFWLYGNTFEYVLGLARNVTMSMLLSPFERREEGALDGLQYYPAVSMPQFNDMAWLTKSLTRPRPTESANAAGNFPVFGDLSELVKEMPPGISYVLIWTPRFINIIPEPGSAAETTDQACKAEALRQTAALPNVRVLDWSEETRPDNHDPINFYDHIHYRFPLAERMEHDIAMSFAALANR
jgi:hypothetical protein